MRDQMHAADIEAYQHAAKELGIEDHIPHTDEHNELGECGG